MVNSPRGRARSIVNQCNVDSIEAFRIHSGLGHTGNRGSLSYRNNYFKSKVRFDIRGHFGTIQIGYLNDRPHASVLRAARFTCAAVAATIILSAAVMPLRCMMRRHFPIFLAM